MAPVVYGSIALVIILAWRRKLRRIPLGGTWGSKSVLDAFHHYDVANAAGDGVYRHQTSRTRSDISERPGIPRPISACHTQNHGLDRSRAVDLRCPFAGGHPARAAQHDNAARFNRHALAPGVGDSSAAL